MCLILCEPTLVEVASLLGSLAALRQGDAPPDLATLAFNSLQSSPTVVAPTFAPLHWLVNEKSDLEPEFPTTSPPPSPTSSPTDRKPAEVVDCFPEVVSLLGEDMLSSSQLASSGGQQHRPGADSRKRRMKAKTGGRKIKTGGHHRKLEGSGDLYEIHTSLDDQDQMKVRSGSSSPKAEAADVEENRGDGLEDPLVLPPPCNVEVGS